MCPSSIQNEWILDGVIASINDDFPAGLPNVILTSCPVTSFNIHVSAEGLAVLSMSRNFIIQRPFSKSWRASEYSYGHRISSVILLSIRKNLCNLSFIVIMTDIQHFCDRNSVTHNKN
jgi:hypothetical protein